MVIEDETTGQLMTFPNVLITAHQAFFSQEALEQIAAVTLKNLDNFEKGNYENVVDIDLIR